MPLLEVQKCGVANLCEHGCAVVLLDLQVLLPLHRLQELLKRGENARQSQMKGFGVNGGEGGETVESFLCVESLTSRMGASVHESHSEQCNGVEARGRNTYRGTCKAARMC